MNAVKHLILIIFLTLVAGCASVYRGYEGEPRNAKELAIVDVTGVAGVNIFAVDGKDRGIGLINVYELLPGKHSLLVNYHSNGREGNITVWFDAVAGEKYTIQAKVNAIQTSWSALVINVRTQKTVNIWPAK